MIHRFVPGAPGVNRVVLLLHGTGGDENDLLPLGQQLVPGAALLSPRGQVLENGMPRFFRRIAEGVFDLDDLKMRTEELGGFIRASAARYGFAVENLVALGYSNGANIASSLLLTHPELMLGAALLRPMVPFVPATLPNLEGKRALVAAGKNDPIVPLGQSSQLADLLRASGAEVTIQLSPGGHGLTQQDLDVTGAWLREGAVTQP
ncbi:MAG: alpha/beta hydrolase [Gemmatimonadota bacterium]